MDSPQSPLITPDDADNDNVDDVEDIFEEIDDASQNAEALHSSLSPSAPSTSLPIVISSVPPPDMAHLLAARSLSILRTLALRNFEIGRKYAYRAAPHVERWLQVRADNLGTTARNLYFRLRVSARKLGPTLDEALQRLQTTLERSDTAVIWFTLLLIFACIVLTLLLWNLI